MNHRLFIYGSLLRDCRNHPHLDGATFVDRTQRRREYRLLDLIGYPGLVPGGLTAVLGELYDVDDALLERLDRFEGVPHLFERRPVALAPRLRIALATSIASAHSFGAEGIEDVAEAYFYARSDEARATTISSGDWRSHHANRIAR